MPHPDTLYLGDNGRALCGEHLGSTARRSGRDLSGHPVLAVTPRMLHDERLPGLACERPGCSRRVDPSPLIV